MKKTEKEIKDYVIERLKGFNPEDYNRVLWDRRLVGSQGPWTLKHLVKLGRVTKEAAEYAEFHFENYDSDVDDQLRNGLYMEVLDMWTTESIKAAQEGDEDYAWMLEDANGSEDELYGIASEESANDFNYLGLKNFLAYIVDEKINE